MFSLNDPKLLSRNFYPQFGLQNHKDNSHPWGHIIHSLNKPILSTSPELLGAKHSTDPIPTACSLVRRTLGLTTTIKGFPGEASGDTIFFPS